MKNFIKNMLSSSSDVSSKRTIGIWLILLFSGVLIYSMCIGEKELSASTMTLSNGALITGSILLGVSKLVEKIK